MSADNWAYCPRCIANLDAEVRRCEAHRKQAENDNDLAEYKVADGYLRGAIEVREAANETFREDYEFYGAEGGTIVASYAGECGACGLSVSFRDEHPFFTTDPL